MFSRGREGRWALLGTRKQHSPEPGKKGALLAVQKESWEVLEDLGGKGGVYSLGGGDSTGGQKDR